MKNGVVPPGPALCLHAPDTLGESGGSQYFIVWAVGLKGFFCVASPRVAPMTVVRYRLSGSMGVLKIQY